MYQATVKKKKKEKKREKKSKMVYMEATERPWKHNHMSPFQKKCYANSTSLLKYIIELKNTNGFGLI